MSEKLFKTRIKQRCDSIQQWQETNPLLLLGELAITVVPPAEESAQPTILMKVGNGTDKYNDLPFITAKAGDVYEWAKAETKPTYTAEEIEGLADYIANEIEDTDTQYQIVPGSADADNKIFIFQSKGKNDTEWTDVYTLTIPEDITYTLSKGEDGELVYTPSKGDVQKIQIVEIETDSANITSESTKVPTAGAVADYVDGKLDNTLDDLNVEDAAVTGEFVTEVKQTDGKIEVKRQKLTVTDISDLEFNSPYDATENKAATMADIDQAAARVFRFKGTVATVAALPSEDNTVGDVYHVKSTKAEYVWVEREDEESGELVGDWEKLGNDMDLSAYPTKDEMDDALALKQDLITETNKLSVDLVNGTATDEKDGLMSAEDKAKLDTIDESAQENKIEKVIAGDAVVPIEDKTVTLAKIAQTGNVMDLIQDDDNVLILDGGNALGFAVEPSTLILNGGNSVR